MINSSPDSPPDNDRPEFCKVAENLYRRTATDVYYALFKRSGKQFRRSLKTTDRALANRRLTDLRQKIARLTLTDTRNALFEALAKSWLDGIRHGLKLASVSRRQVCITGLAPYFNQVPIRNISAAQCAKWLEKRGAGLSASSFDQELDTLRLILAHGVERGLLLENPALGIKRRKLAARKIVVPSRDQFQSIIAAVRDADNRYRTHGKGSDGADLLELLAYSGCRLGEAVQLRWQDVDFERGCITVTGGETGTKNHEPRIVPMASALRDLLQRLQQRGTFAPTDRISQVDNAKKCLGTACRNLGLPHFSHHNLRHFFATTCIESGVDIPTISRWLGHKDGGALAMRVYGHLRQEHSFEMSKRVNFDNKPMVPKVVQNLTKAVP